MTWDWVWSVAGLVAIALVCLAIAAGTVYALSSLINRMLRPSPDKPKPEPDHKFCSDCGKAYAKYRQAGGFDGATGKRIYRVLFGCPDASPYSSYAYSSGRSGFNCGAAQQGLGIIKVCAHGDQIDMNCTNCLSTLVDNGVLTVEQAKLAIPGPSFGADYDPPYDPSSYVPPSASFIYSANKNRP